MISSRYKHNYRSHVIISTAVRLTAPGGTLWLTHVEDQGVFDRYIDAGDLSKTEERMKKLAEQNELGEGFVGMYL